jgi:hypothetical protein
MVNETARRLCLRLLAVDLKLESMKPIERVATSFIAFPFAKLREMRRNGCAEPDWQHIQSM